MRKRAQAGRRDATATSALEAFRPLFEPQTVAVLGASTNDVAIANTFIRRMKDFGYQRRTLSDPSQRAGGRRA